jgi:Xaa-Pro aminopeptidase
VTDILIVGDTTRSPEMRHEVPVTIPDPFLYAEVDGARHVVTSSFELPRLQGLGLEVHPNEEFGLDELRRAGIPALELDDELNLRAVKALGLTRAAVPGTFPVGLADKLRAAGVELVPDDGLFVARRRVKTGAELAGIRRAQVAAEAGMTAARELLRRATVNGAGLELDGEPLTSERLKHAIAEAFVAHDATCEVFLVAHCPQSAIGHETGSGRIRPSEPIVIDVWPRDNESACSADMTRTFVVGDVPDEVAAWHCLCRQALDRALADLRPGVTGRSAYDAVCDIFEAAGYPTQRTKPEGETLEEGFYHSLGHAIGLDVHEQPVLGLLGREDLLAGEVFAVEPGLYRPGLGGVRLEDVVLLTEDGVEKLTSFPYDLEP